MNEFVLYLIIEKFVFDLLPAEWCVSCYFFLIHELKFFVYIEKLDRVEQLMVTLMVDNVRHSDLFERINRMKRTFDDGDREQPATAGIFDENEIAYIQVIFNSYLPKIASQFCNHYVLNIMLKSRLWLWK